METLEEIMTNPIAPLSFSSLPDEIVIILPSIGQFCDEIRLKLENDFMKSLQAEAVESGELEAIKHLPWYPKNLSFHTYDRKLGTIKLLLNCQICNPNPNLLKRILLLLILRILMMMTMNLMILGMIPLISRTKQKQLCTC
ncbi:unnamed protein product [Arabidopsis halleri]